MSGSRNLVAQFVLRLTDRASQGLMRLQQRIQGLAAAARRVALIGGALAGLSVAGPVREAAALEQQMRQTAITAGLSGEAVERMMARNLAMFQAVSRETNIRVRELAGAAGVLVAGGGEAGQVWEQLIPVIGRVASASGANAGDLSQSVLAMVNNLKIAPGEVEQALASMVQAGKEGQFELRDMAREFAGLTAAAAGIGLTGPRAIHSLAAALQVARQGAGSAGEAATNLTNILQKMTSPDAVRNFREMGVDIEAVLGDAASRGINPLEAVIQKVRELSGGNMFRVSELFGDSQVLAFLRPMIQQTERYIEVRDRAAQADGSIIATDQATAMRGLAAELQRLVVLWDEFTTRLGQVAERWLPVVTDALRAVWDRVKELDAAFPGVVEGGAALLAGGLALAAGLGVLGVALGPVIAGIGLLLSPIGLAVAGAVALGLAAWWIYDNWGAVAGWFTEQWSALRDGMAPQVDWLLGAVTGMGTALVEPFMAAWRPLSAFFTGLWAGIRASFDGAIGGITATLDRITAAWDAVRARLGLGGPGEAETPTATPEERRRNFGGRGAAGGFYPPETLAGAAGAGAANSNTPVNGEIVVRAAPGAEVVAAEGSNRNVPLTAAPNRGATRSRP